MMSLEIVVFIWCIINKDNVDDFVNEVNNILFL